MVGRDQELALLGERWAQAGAARASACCWSARRASASRASPGRCSTGRRPTAPSLRYQCSPYHLDSALWPMIQQLNRGRRLRPEDPPEVRLDKIESLLGRAATTSTRRCPCRQPARRPYERSLRAARSVAAGAASRGPSRRWSSSCSGWPSGSRCWWCMEDVHWIDPSTLEFVRPGARPDRRASAVLLLLTSRPDGQPALAGHPHVTRLVLNRLGRARRSDDRRHRGQRRAARRGAPRDRCTHRRRAAVRRGADTGPRRACRADSERPRRVRRGVSTCRRPCTIR